MSIRVVFPFFLLAAAIATGQPQAAREQARVPRSLNHGNWVGKRVLTPEFMEKVGIRGDQAAKLKAEMDALDAKSGQLDEVINKAAAEQAEVAKKVLAEPGAKTDEIMKMIERIGQYRIEQAKLATQRLVVIRDTLTPEQRQKASELLNVEGKRRFEERAARLEREEKERKGATPHRPAAPKGW
jgi:hypothetical protein